MADALMEAHSKGIVHRDIKPQLTESGLIIGTVPYMSPEQVKGESLDVRSDIFSFGTVLYEMISGHHPFAAKTVAETISAILMTDASPFANHTNHAIHRVDEIVRRCLEKDRERRYQNIAAVAIDLKSAQQSNGGPLGVLSSTTEATKVLSTDQIPKQNRFRMSRFLNTGWMKALAALGLIAIVALGYTKFFPGGKLVPKSEPGSNNLAYDHYLRGKVIAGRQNRTDNETAINLLEQAVSADPSFAAAWAELARAYSIKAFYHAPETDRKHWNLEADVAVEKALSLAPNLAEGHAARAFVLWTPDKGFPHELAIQSYQRALELNPDLEEAHHQLATIFFHIGLLDKSWAEVEKGLAINPANTLMRFRFGVINIYRAKYEEALQALKSIPLDANPSLVDRNIATALFQLGRTDEAFATVEKYLRAHPEDEGGAMTSVKAMLLAKAGQGNEAEELIKRSIEIGNGFGHFHHTAYNIASAYALLNKRGEAIKWLEEAADDGFPCYPWFEKDATLNSLRNDDSFKSFMNKLRKRWEQYKAKFGN
jgi:tetratricopeptide (TPR) repeat protein